ncbi:MAG: hypothetical protein IJ710_05695 [Prevotella sp.]|nr:hypothetical protein [Prevotella sp.]
MKVTCPYCYEIFDSKDVMLRCRRCPEEEDNVYFAYWEKVDSENANKMQRHAYHIRHRFLRKDDMSCDVCGSKDYDYICPSCHNELPAKMVEDGAEIISVIGGPNSGKTHYIIALLYELRKHGYEIGLDATLEQVGEDKNWHTDEMYRKAIRTLNTNHEVLQKTAQKSISLPWIIRLDSTDPKKNERQDPKKSIYLVFYDTAGESFEDNKQIQANAQYLRQSKAVIVLFDTTSIPAIKDILLQKNEELGRSDADRDDFDITWNTLKRFVIDNEAVKNKPVAFVLSKFDVVLKYHERLGFDCSSFLSPSGLVDKSYINGLNVFDMNQIKDAHDAIASSMREWDMGAYPKEFKTIFPIGRFFGMSAIGSKPNGSIITTNSIRPYRVMDPLLWTMAKIGGFAFETINDDTPKK